MVYLYAGLGVVMLSGIIAIFEMGLALTGQSLLPIPVNTYIESDEQMRDYDLFFFANSRHPDYPSSIAHDLQNTDICNAVISSAGQPPRIQAPGRVYEPKNFWHSALMSGSVWDESCVMEYENGMHQVLLMPSSQSSEDNSMGNYYLVFSCTDDQSASPLCPFEEK